uniref:Uncharacterized protein n=1 Tax=Schistosoma japonicum TaxID=6182 RepID=C1LTL8_SCHJA|nr:hypothetical protein [Schistosoma japonicum]
MSADSWDNHCVTYVANNKCLKNLCMTAIDGSHLGTSNPDFRFAWLDRLSTMIKIIAHREILQSAVCGTITSEWVTN